MMSKKELYLVEAEEEIFIFPEELINWIKKCLEKNIECYVAIKGAFQAVSIKTMLNTQTFNHFPIVYHILAGDCEGKVEQIYVKEK